MGQGIAKFVKRKCKRKVVTFQEEVLERSLRFPGYAASKGAVAQLIKAFANEWASKGVNVNGVAPGYVATDNTAALQPIRPVRRR